MWPNWAGQGLALEEQHHRKRKRGQLASSRVGQRFQLEEVELVLPLRRDGLQLPGLAATLHKCSRQLFDLLMNCDNNSPFDVYNSYLRRKHVDFELQRG